MSHLYLILAKIVHAVRKLRKEMRWRWMTMCLMKKVGWMHSLPWLEITRTENMRKEALRSMLMMLRHRR